MKKGFLLYTSQRGPIQKLSREEKGELLEMIYTYNATGTFGTSTSIGVNVVFEFMKTTFIDNDDKYNNICIRNKQNAEKRRKKNATGKTGIPKSTRNANNDNDNDNDKKINIPFDVFRNLYDKKIERPKTEQKRNSLKPEERETIIKILPARKKQYEGDRKTFQPYPATYLNNRRREDEISTPITDKEKALEERRAKRDREKARDKGTFTGGLIQDEDTI